MQAIVRDPEFAILRDCLEAARSRPCLLCDRSGDGAFVRCRERYPGVRRLLVVARGSRRELALVPVVWDGVGEVGCVELEALALVRPETFADEERPVAALVNGFRGRLWTAARFGAEGPRLSVLASELVLAWQAAAVYPVADADAAREGPRPQRTVVDPDAPGYGRWPAPWLPWASIADAVPWDQPPFRGWGTRAGARSSQAAFAAAGLPPAGLRSHPLAKALALAALLRSVPGDGGQRTLGSRLLPPQGPVPAVVGICRQRVYRFAPDGGLERLFAGEGDDSLVGVRQIEEAEGHARMADFFVRTRPENAEGGTG